MGIHVNADTFARAETARMFADIQRDAGGVNRFRHNRTPAPIEAQTVIRLNRDTLYSFAITDISAGATLTLPDAGGRYISAMVVDEDHFVRAVWHEPGRHDIRAVVPAGVGDHVLVAVRTLVDPSDPADIAEVARVQDALVLEAAAATPFACPEFDTVSFDATRDALLALAAGLTGFERMFGGPDDVDPVRHLIGTAAGWGGLPTWEATYVGVAPGLAPAAYDLVMRDVPVDAFWSISVYNARGFFEPNEAGLYTVNSVTGTPDADGAVTVRLRPEDRGEPNTVIVPEGWNLLVRLYRPRPEALDGSWQVPELVPAG